MDPAAEYFRALREVLPAEEVRIAGAWSAKPQLRYASPTQQGTGEGPFVETVDWRWEGTVESATPVAGIAIRVIDHRASWAKSQPAVAQAPLVILATGWAESPGSVSFSGGFHGASLPSAPVDLSAEPPASVVLGPSRTKTGLLHVVARAGRAALAVVLVPGSAVKVGRNRLWHLRDEFASRLPPDLQRLMTRGRSGQLVFAR